MSHFQHDFRVYIEDTDVGGVVYYVNYLKFMERARTEWLRRLGFDFEALCQQGCMFVVKHVDVDYLSPARMDDLLHGTVKIVKMARTYINFEQTLVRDEHMLCRAIVKIGCIDTSTFRPIKIPEAIQMAVNIDKNT